jgi:hypothetical protein
MIRCTCPFCGTTYELGDEVADQKLRCEVCRKAFVWSAARKREIPVDEPGPQKPRESRAAPVTAAPLPTSSGGRGAKAGILIAVAVAVVWGICIFAPRGGPPAAPAESAPVPRKRPLPSGPPATRAANYEEALALAKESGRDIVVFQRGSDWNRLAETLYHEVWLKDEFAQDLGEKFVLVAVDRPEVVGGRFVRVTCSDASCGDKDSTNDFAVGNSPPLRLATLADVETLPSNEVAAVESKDGSVFKQRDDGTWIAEGASPGQETLTLRIRPARGGSVLRLDFPTDPGLPGNGPGRASNGNFAISEIEALAGTNAIAIEAAWASAAEGAWGAWQTIDGVSDKGDNLWNPSAHLHQRRTLLLALRDGVPAGGEVAVRLVCRSQWSQHVPGCLRAAVLSEKQVGDDVRRVGLAQLEQQKNGKFSWWDTTHIPRVALMDGEGRAVACDNKPRLGLTPETLADRVRELRATREKRDALWAQAEQAQGPAKAELLRQSLDLLGFANWAGNDNGYKFVHDKIREADPKDESGAVRWLGFGGDPKSGVPWAEPNWAKALEGKDLTDANYEEALARIDKELKDPRNRVLDHERIQRIMVAKYHLYKRWPNHQEQRFDVQREIAAFDPSTFWGIGAVGYLGMYHRAATPLLTYGWATNEVRTGLNAWDMTDTAYYFDHAGPYKVKMTSTGGKDALKVRRIALIDGDAVLSEARPEAELGPGKGPVEADIDFKDWSADRRVVLRVEAEAAEGHTDCIGNFAVEPQLLPPAVIHKTPARVAAPKDGETARRVASGEIDTLQRELGDGLMADAGQGESGLWKVVGSAAQRARLAQHELIRCCTAEKVAEIAKSEGGAGFLAAFLADSNWLESFLASGGADWPQALENLNLLSHHGEGMDDPLYRRVATALALQWGGGSRYRLVDRFRHIRWAHQQGLLHASFDGLNVREMRWAVPTYGSAQDYQFLLDDRQTTLGDYFGACWGVGYIDPNVYGDSVQTWLYITPWTHHYGTGTGNRPFPAHRQVGGVCGTLSGYGSAVAQAHGVMSTTVGQPGHCAYVIRVGEDWPVGFSVTWPTSVSAPGWEGTGYSTFRRLYEPVHADRERFMNAARLAWVARLQADRAKVRTRILPGLRYSVYRQGVGAGLPDFSTLAPESTGTCAKIDLASVQPQPPNNFGVVWEGQIEAAGEGAVRFVAHSDDSSRVLVDGQPVVAANCNRQEKEIPVSPGRHDLRVEFSQGTGGLLLSTGFEGVLSATAGVWAATYERAISAQPTNYGTWIEYIKALEAARDVSEATWLELGRRAARSLAVCHEAGWALTMRCLDKALPAMKPAERVVVLEECNRELREEKWVKKEGFPYDGVLNWQADRIGEPVLAVQFFGRLLAIHHSAKPEDNWIFGNVMGWGARRFAGNPATAQGYARAIADFFKSEGEGVDKNLLASTIAGGIRKASEAGDLASYRLWSDMAATMLPPLKPEDVHLNAAQAAAVPKYQPFPGDLLSKDGMLRSSSACQFDRPFSYAQILSGGFGGWFDTNNEEKPWAEVQLAGDGELSGIVLLNRYEYAPNQEEFQWAAPLKVSVSADGKSWTDVASFDKADSVFRVDLQGKALRARHVRIERLPAADKTQAPGRFHFRNFLVYGRKLY